MIFATVTGNLGKDAVVRAAGKDNVCSFAVASESKVKGEKVTSWCDCSLFGKRGEALCQYLTKGTKVTVVGELSTREHNGKTYLQVRVSEIAMQGGGGDRKGGSAAIEKPKSAGGGYDSADYAESVDDDPIPFALNVSCHTAELWWRWQW